MITLSLIKIYDVNKVERGFSLLVQATKPSEK